MAMIVLTDSARDKIFSLMRKEGHTDPVSLRVSVVGGGCSGFSYKLGFEKVPQDQDSKFLENQVQVVVDPKSALFIQGLRIDYVDGLNGAGFVYENPKAAKSCGCGTSFAV